MSDGGYDEGYSRCPCFWGETPAGMVNAAIKMFESTGKKAALDLGCGDGKNASALARAGFRVLAIDKSEIAISNAMRNFPAMEVSWLVSDLTEIGGPAEAYDVVVATGSLHCLSSKEAIERAIAVIQRMTKKSGLNVISSFNDGRQNMDGHDPEFRPTLLPHDQYLRMYLGWDLLQASSVVQPDVHPHNNIPHTHSITRILARRNA